MSAPNAETGHQRVAVREETYSIKGGSLTVRPLRARPIEREDGEETPMLQVEGTATVRGRKYTVSQPFLWGQMWDAGKDLGLGWVVAAQEYSEGFRNDKGQTVGFRTATYDDLLSLCRDVLDSYSAAHMSWRLASKRLLWQAMIDRAEKEATEAEREANACAAKVAALKARYARLMYG